MAEFVKTVAGKRTGSAKFTKDTRYKKHPKKFIAKEPFLFYRFSL